MSDTLAKWLIPALISGAISIGVAVYSIKASARTAREQFQEQRRSISLDAVSLLNIEITVNLRILRDVYNKVNYRPSGRPHDEEEFRKRLYFINEPLPKWLRGTWDSQSINLASVLSDDTIRRLTDHFSQLEYLADYQTSLKAKLPSKLESEYRAWDKAHDARPNQAGTFDSSGYLAMDIRRYNDETSESWNNCIGTMNTLLSWDNSLLEPETKLPPDPSWWTRIRGRLPIIKVIWPRQINPA